MTQYPCLYNIIFNRSSLFCIWVYVYVCGRVDYLWLLLLVWTKNQLIIYNYWKMIWEYLMSACHTNMIYKVWRLISPKFKIHSHHSRIYPSNCVMPSYISSHRVESGPERYSGGMISRIVSHTLPLERPKSPQATMITIFIILIWLIKRTDGAVKARKSDSYTAANG